MTLVLVCPKNKVPAVDTASWCVSLGSLLSPVELLLCFNTEWHIRRDGTDGSCLHFLHVPLDNGGGGGKRSQFGSGSQIPNPSVSWSGWDNSRVFSGGSIALCGHIKSDKTYQQWALDILGLLQATLNNSFVRFCVVFQIPRTNPLSTLRSMK